MIIVTCPHPVKTAFKIFFIFFLLDFGIEKAG